MASSVSGSVAASWRTRSSARLCSLASAARARHVTATIPINVCNNSNDVFCDSGRMLSAARHNNPVASSLGGNGYGPSLFRDPQAAYNCFRNPILGLANGHNGGAGNLRGQPFWNVDFSVKKNVMIAERFSAEFGAIFTNISTITSCSTPSCNLAIPGIGALSMEIYANAGSDTCARRTTV